MSLNKAGNNRSFFPGLAQGKLWQFPTNRKRRKAVHYPKSRGSHGVHCGFRGQFDGCSNINQLKWMISLMEGSQYAIYYIIYYYVNI